MPHQPTAFCKPSQGSKADEAWAAKMSGWAFAEAR
jgi:hypothetical protein